MKSKIVKIISIVMCLAVICIGCGNGKTQDNEAWEADEISGEESNTDTSAQVSADEEAATADEGETAVETADVESFAAGDWQEAYKKVIDTYAVASEDWGADPWWFLLADIDDNKVPEMLYGMEAGARGIITGLNIAEFEDGKCYLIPVDTSSCNGITSWEVMMKTKNGDREWVFNYFEDMMPEYLDAASEEWAYDLEKLVYDGKSKIASTEVIVQNGACQYGPDRELTEDEKSTLLDFASSYQVVDYISKDWMVINPSFGGNTTYYDERNSGELTDDVIDKFFDSWWCD